MQNWKIIAAAVAGTAHLGKNELCADAFLYEIFSAPDGEKVLLIVASDGAGSAKAGKTGADATCASLKREIQMFVERDGQFQVLTFDNALGWIERLQNDLTQRATRENLSLSDYACTLLVAVVGETETIFMQIGDGAIVYSTPDKENEYRVFTRPQQGEYANSTFFVTDQNARESLNLKLTTERIQEIAIFTDGLQRIALNLPANTAHAPFFRSMLAPLRALEPRDEDFRPKLKNLEKQLSDFLDSSKINERTDDDKTLILASRRSP